MTLVVVAKVVVANFPSGVSPKVQGANFHVTIRGEIPGAPARSGNFSSGGTVHAGSERSGSPGALGSIQMLKAEMQRGDRRAPGRNAGFQP